MNKETLINKLHAAKEDTIYVLIEDDLFYPIKEVISYKGNTVIVCKNVKKIESE